jgi:hypothetical protein
LIGLNNYIKYSDYEKNAAHRVSLVHRGAGGGIPLR